MIDFIQQAQDIQQVCVMGCGIIVVTSLWAFLEIRACKGKQVLVGFSDCPSKDTEQQEARTRAFSNNLKRHYAQK